MLHKLDYRFPITNEMLIATMLDPRLQNLPRLLSELNGKSISKFEFLKSECLKIIDHLPAPVIVEVRPKAVALDTSETTKAKRVSTMSKLIEKHVYDSVST